MDSGKNGHGDLAVLEMAGACQSSRCCGPCACRRLGCARHMASKRLFAAATVTASAIDDLESEATRFDDSGHLKAE
jgi:hypothetical protein